MRNFIFTSGLIAALANSTGTAGQEPRSEQAYYPGSFNWTFLESTPEAARLFNAFDYGHAVLSEVLWTVPHVTKAGDRLDREYLFLTQDLLIRPPRFAVAEEAVAPAYVRLAGRAQGMFHWAHVLHRQLYDVYADDRMSDAAKLELGERLTDFYLRSSLAFAPVPKTMELMDEQYYSQVFRNRYPGFNGLVWAYHWLQVGLYEPLIAGGSSDVGKQGVGAAVTRFFHMISEGPDGYPSVMPMTPTVAPEFTKRHPRAAAIFDNLHMMHDIISDILASPDVPRARKRAVIYEALDEFQDTTRNVLTTEEWMMMGHHMGGIDAMGGSPIPGAAIPETPAPTPDAAHGHGGHHE